MAVTRGWLLDKSGLARWHEPHVGSELERRLRSRQLFTCAVIELEVLYSARSPADYAEIIADRRQAYEWVEIDAATWRRAADLQARLAAQSQVRAAGVADLLIAATAMQHGLTVLHYDRDFELLARLGGVSEEPVAPLGSLS